MNILNEWPTKRKWLLDDLNFFYEQKRAETRFGYSVDERALQRLRDMVEKYVTN